MAQISILLTAWVAAGCATDGSLQVGPLTTSSVEPAAVAPLPAKPDAPAATGSDTKAKKPADTAPSAASVKPKPAPAKAKAQAEVVEAPYRPAVGTRWLHLSKTEKTRTKAGKVVESSVTTETNHVIIESEITGGYRQKMYLIDATIQSDSQLAKIMTPVLEASKGLSVSYDTDEAGVPARINNLDEVKGFVRQAFGTLEKSKPEMFAVPQVVQSIDGIKSQFENATEDTGPSIFMREEINVTQVQGFGLRMGEPRGYETQVASLVGGTMNAKGSLNLVKVDKARGLAIIEHRLTVDPKDLTRVLTAYLQKVLPQAAAGSPEFQAAMTKLQFDRAEQATYQVALADGVVRRMDKLVKVTSADFEQKEVTTFTSEQLQWTEDKVGSALDSPASPVAR